MSKLSVLNNFVKQKFNVHRFEVVNDVHTLSKYAHEFINSSVRFDNDIGSLQLPFAVLDNGNFNMSDIQNIVNEAKRLNCYLLVSNGRHYDPLLEYNLVINIKESGEFECDISDLKVPLRHMYKHPLMGIIGDITKPIHWWDLYGSRLGNLVNIRHRVEEVYTKGIYNKYIECTSYKHPVGVFHQNIVYWHIC